MSPAGLKAIAEEAGLELVVVCGSNMGDNWFVDYVEYVGVESIEYEDIHGNERWRTKKPLRGPRPR